MQATRRRRNGAFCTIDQRDGNGGIARVSSLVWRVLNVLPDAKSRLIALSRPDSESITGADKARFAARVVGGQIARSFDWLFFDHVGPASMQGYLPAGIRRPYGIFLHSIEVWGELGAAKLRTLRRASVLIANSEFTAQRTSAAHPDVGPIQVCHLALPSDEFRGEGTSDGDRQIDYAVVNRIRKGAVLIVGRMASSERHKGHEVLIRMWPSVRERVRECQLVVVGRGDDAQRLQELAAGVSAGDDVFFTSGVNDVTLSEIYRRAEVYAMPSNGEGFGVVFLEAMSHSLPCIASRTDGSREIIVDGETGFLVDPAAPNQIRDRLAALLNDAKSRERMGRAGRERAQQQFSFDKFKDRFLAAIAPLLSGERVGERRS